MADRDINRVLQHTKQSRVRVATKAPSASELTEGKFEFRFINNTLYIVTKNNGKVWYFKGSNSY